jgi:hypothetical protein
LSSKYSQPVHRFALTSEEKASEGLLGVPPQAGDEESEDETVVSTYSVGDDLERIHRHATIQWVTETLAQDRFNSFTDLQKASADEVAAYLLGGNAPPYKGGELIRKEWAGRFTIRD